MILIDIIGAGGVIRSQEVLTSGMIGAAVEFRFDESWDTLAKTVVFRANGVTKDVVGIDSVAVIPSDVLQVPGVPLHIGVYGKNTEDKIVIPTVWVKTDPIRDGADPNGDESTDPALPVWAQLEERVVAAEAVCKDTKQTVDDLNARMDAQQETIGQSAQSIIDDGIKDVQAIKDDISQEMAATVLSVQATVDTGIEDMQAIKTAAAQEAEAAQQAIGNAVAQGLEDMQEIKAAAEQDAETARQEVEYAVAKGLEDMRRTAEGNEAYTKAESDALFGPAIVCEASSSLAIIIDGAASAPLQGLSIFGKTTQSGTPAPDAPVALESAGAGGSITVSCGFTPNYTRAVIPTPNGLPGIPVDEGGSYTDTSGQQWIADEIDFARGVYVQRVGSHTVTDADVGTQFQDGCVQLINPTDFLHQKGTPMLCDRFVNNREAYCDGISTAARYLSDGEFSNRYWETSTARFLYFKSSLFTDIATAKAWFAANETVVLYPLAEPVETAIPEEEMAAYHGLRTAYPATIAKNDAGAYMHIKYVADTKLYIDKKLADISAAMLNT